MLSGRQVMVSLKNPHLVMSLFVTTLIIQVATGSVAPILTLYVRELAGQTDNLAFISGAIAAIPGVSALLSAPPVGKTWRQNWPGTDSGCHADTVSITTDPHGIRAITLATGSITFPARCG
ncbi:hypothetical protein OS12_11960 [Dickeya oryzae]